MFLRTGEQRQTLVVGAAAWPGHDVDELARLLGRLASEVVGPVAESTPAR